jgi:predicted glycoside hydrolase/deacetylase ChbG (UPF0249 family)
MNSFLSKLNLPEDARVVVIHADDIGMSYSTVAGFPALLDAGILSSAAVMTPCPWFPGAAAMLREMRGHPRLDVGVHLTLNSEWSRYRWGPLSTRDRASGLLDGEGYFHRLEMHVWSHADAGAVETELRAQIDAALAAGVDVTHIDSHMGTLFHPRLLGVYLKLAREYSVPAFLLRPNAEHIQSANLSPEDERALMRIINESEAWGLPFFDHFHVMDLNHHENRLGQARSVLSALPPGSMTYLILHPAMDAPDLQAFAPDWQARIADYQLLADPAFEQLLAELGITVIGMRALREAMRRAA